ncbi:MAG: tetratricopeptide repeat protein [Myxococcota bacterium]
MRGLLAAVWLAGGSALAATDAETVQGPVPDEVKAFKAAEARFAERMTELEDDTRAYVDLREQEEMSAVEAEYADRLDTLVAEQKGHREETIARFETFLAEHPSLPYASHVRFRLAEMYFEKASEDWLAVAEAYNAKLNDPNTPIAELEALGPEPRRDLGKSLELYRKIIDDNLGKPPSQQYERLDGTFLMTGFVYNDPNSLQYDPTKAKETFEELIREMPQSDLADRAHLFLGNFLFDDNQFDPALAEYQFVYDKGPEGKYFEEALYQLAWAKYKLDEFDEALRLFTELLDLSEQRKVDTGKDSSFAPDARRFMAFSFADIAYDIDGDAVQVAKKYFGRIGERDYEREVYRQLADVLIRYTRPREAIETYTLLQEDPRWTLEPDDPVYQIALIDLYLTSVARDLAAAGEQRLVFIQKYSEGTPWWEANRNDPEALDVARGYIESSLLDVAIEYRVRAQESGQPADYALAAEKYSEYLEKFPISDDYYKQQWYLADSLKLAGEYDRALAEFESLVKSRRYHAYGDAAMYSLMDVRLQRMGALNHAPDQEPTDAEVERTYTAGDKTIEVWKLSEDRQKFIAAADMVLRHEFKPSTDPELPDYQQAVGERRPSILYLTGQILFYHHHLDEARKRFEELIDKYPRSLEANYAAGLLVDSYLMENNLAQVRTYSRRFTLNPPGPPSNVDPTRFSDTLEATTFKLALEQAETADPLQVAESFLAFRQEFPKSDLAADALYNAAYYNQQAGKVDEANRLYEQFVKEYPNEERAKGLFFRIAANYEATFQLEKAISYYDRVLRHPDATPAEKADAQYNRSFLLIGLGKHREAAEGYEAYEANYPDQPDREQIMFLAGEQWEKVSTDDAIAFWKRYEKRYPDANPDHYLEAQYRILQGLQEQKADASKIRAQRAAIVSDFERFARNGDVIGPKGNEYAAAAEYPVLEQAFEDYAGDQLTGNETKDARLLNQTKPAELKKLEDQVKSFVARYQNFEYNSGALLLQAKAALALADLGLSIRCPKKLSQEDCWLYEEVLEEKVFPQYYEVEEVGLRRLQELVEGAKAKKRHSRFIDEAMAELNRRRPAEYPAVKRELEGGTDAAMPVDIRPLRFERVQAPAPEAPVDDGNTPPPEDGVDVPSVPAEPAPDVEIPSPVSPAPAPGGDR